jgi:hypothetical protein
LAAHAVVVQVEFADESSDSVDESSEDVLATRSAHLPSWFIALIIAGVAAIAVVVLVQGQPAGKQEVAARSSAVATTPVRPPAVADELLAAIYQRGRDVAPAEDIIRGGSVADECKSVQIGTSPQHAASAALRENLPGYRIVDTARIIDQSAGLCALQVRARDGSGNVALIIVTSPPLEPTLGRNQSLVARAGAFRDLFVEYAEFTTQDGWTVVVGTSGPKGREPSTTALGELASNPALRW